MKRRLREITCRSNGKGDAWRKQTLRYFVTGWTNYFRFADMSTHLQKIDEWLRRFICSTTITNDRLKRAGYIFFGEYFKRIQPPIPGY
jgi:hypothetical protein